MQELDSQRGEGAYFWGDTVCVKKNNVCFLQGCRIPTCLVNSCTRINGNGCMHSFVET